MLQRRRVSAAHQQHPTGQSKNSSFTSVPAENTLGWGLPCPPPAACPPTCTELHGSPAVVQQPQGGERAKARGASSDVQPTPAGGCCFPETPNDGFVLSTSPTLTSKHPLDALQGTGSTGILARNDCLASEPLP